MSAGAEGLRREIVRKCQREQFDAPLASAVEAALGLIASGWLRIEQVRKPRQHRPCLYCLLPITPGKGGRT